MEVKLHISNLLRKLGLLRFTDSIRFAFQKAKRKGMNSRFKKQHAQFEFPPPYFIYETYQLDYDRYYNDGLVTAGEIIDAIKKYKPGIGPGFAILDWGCGPGRITRHLPGFLPSGSSVHGTDYNAQYVSWCQQNIPGIDWTTNTLHPPLNFGEETFDAIIGLSVFTHLAESSHSSWLKELHRICRQDGILLLTTQGIAFRNKLIASEIKSFDEGNIVVRENKLEGHRLFSAFHPPSTMQRLFQPWFHICELSEGSNLQGDEPSQDIWILKKRNLNG
jgi:2-polyprenyl-3-methyl-5-hydroxy-6-metoxy-1,4-benzoquinol methylase